MADIIRGLKAGFGAGIISGLAVTIISGVLILTISYPGHIVLFKQVLAKILPGVPIDIDMFIMISEIVMLPTELIIGAIIGVIFGLIYAFLYNRLPGKTAIPKGLFIGLVCFIIFLLLGKMAFSGEVASIEQDSLITSANYIINFVAALIFGYFIGWFWNELEPEE